MTEFDARSGNTTLSMLSGDIHTISVDAQTGMPISTPENPLTPDQLELETKIQRAWDSYYRDGDRSGLVALGLLPAVSMEP